MNENERPEQPAEARLIARAQQLSGISNRKAAERAGISDGRWRQIVSGYQTVSAGVYAPVRAPAPTLARMAKAVDVTAEDLVQAGRPDAAELLVELSRNDDRTRSVTELLDESEAMLAELHERLDRLPPRRIGTVLRLVRDLDEEDPPESDAR